VSDRQASSSCDQARLALGPVTGRAAFSRHPCSSASGAMSSMTVTANTTRRSPISPRQRGSARRGSPSHKSRVPIAGKRHDRLGASRCCRAGDTGRCLTAMGSAPSGSTASCSPPPRSAPLAEPPIATERDRLGGHPVRPPLSLSCCRQRARCSRCQAPAGSRPPHAARHRASCVIAAPRGSRCPQRVRPRGREHASARCAATRAGIV
jgi:hypothetical protein